MSLRLGYITPKQRLALSLKSERYMEAGIGRKLNIKRQTVHKALNIANMKIQALRETAKIKMIETQTVSPNQGYLTGYSPHFDTESFVTYSSRNDIQICYPCEGNCTRCNRANKCRKTLSKKLETERRSLRKTLAKCLHPNLLKPYSPL